MSTVDRRVSSRVPTFVACALVLLLPGCATTPDHTTKAAEHSVAFAVEGNGTADITWSGATDGTAAHTALPWHTTVPGSVGEHPATVSIVLDQRGGQASCSITVDGRRVSSSLAQGAFGRATCHTPTSAGSAPQSDA